MADSFNLNKILIFINIVKNTKSRDPKLEFRDVVGAQSLSIPSFVRRFVGKLVINLVDNKLPLVLSERPQIRDCLERIFDVVHGRSGVVDRRFSTPFCGAQASLRNQPTPFRFLCLAWLNCQLELGTFTRSGLALRKCEIAMPVATSYPAGLIEPRVMRVRSNDQAYFLTAFSMAPPALARSSGVMTG